MSISITSSLATASLAAANSSSTSAAAQPAQPTAQPAAQPTANGSAYTVTLSEAQQVYNLYNQGQAVLQIASNLSLTVDAVNSYLGITAGS
jgi:DNA-binding NarL/FixJ family response regulator